MKIDIHNRQYMYPYFSHYKINVNTLYMYVIFLAYLLLRVGSLFMGMTGLDKW